METIEQTLNRLVIRTESDNNKPRRKTDNKYHFNDGTLIQIIIQLTISKILYILIASGIESSKMMMV